MKKKEEVEKVAWLREDLSIETLKIFGWIGNVRNANIRTGMCD